MEWFQIGKAIFKADYCHLAYLNYMQSTSYKMPDWMKHKLESRVSGEISITSDTQMTPSLWVKWRGTKKPLGESERGEWKSCLKNLTFKKWRPWHLVPWLQGKQMGKKMDIMADFVFLGSKITADGDWSHEIKRYFLFGRKAMTNLDSILKSSNITLLTKVCLVKAMVFPVVMYGYESWNIKKAEHERIDVFERWCWRRLLRVPWAARRSTQSIQKKISSEYSLQGLMLKLKILYFGHLMWRTNSSSFPDAGKDWGQEEEVMTEDMIGWHPWHNGHEIEQALELVMEGGRCAAVHGFIKSQTWLSEWTELKFVTKTFYSFII